MLLSPAHFALFLVNHHMQVMESFVDAPEMHLEAAQDGSLMGAPFMNQPFLMLMSLFRVFIFHIIFSLFYFFITTHASLISSMLTINPRELSSIP